MSELLTFVLEHEQFRKARLPSLYSDFRYLKTTNPNGFHANVTAWKAVLADACKAGKVGDGSDRLVLTTSDDLVSSIQTRDWGRPLALGIVVAEALHNKDLYPLDQFLSQKESIYSWSYAGAALNWGLERLGLRGPPGTESRGIVNGRYVVVKNVEDMAQSIARAMSSRTTLTDRIFTVDLFATEFAPTLSATDLQVLLRHLSRDRAYCAFNGDTIKFRGVAEEEDPAQVTQQDTTIAHLKSLLKSLHSRVDTLSNDITRCTQRAQAAVASKNRPVALAALKSRKTAEGALSHQVKALGQIEDVMAAIQQAADNIELVRILKQGSKVLSGLNKEIGSASKVDEVMEGLQQETDTVDEVNRILSERGVVVDEEAVEDELEAMMQEVEETEHAERMREALGRIPAIDEAEKQLSDSLGSMKIRDDGEKDKTEERTELHAS